MIPVSKLFSHTFRFWMIFSIRILISFLKISGLKHYWINIQHTPLPVWCKYTLLGYVNIHALYKWCADYFSDLDAHATVILVMQPIFSPSVSKCGMHMLNVLTMMMILSINYPSCGCFRCTQIKTYSWDNAQVVLVGNKCDLEDERVVSADRGKQLADQLGTDHQCCVTWNIEWPKIDYKSNLF